MTHQRYKVLCIIIGIVFALSAFGLSNDLGLPCEVQCYHAEGESAAKKISNLKGHVGPTLLPDQCLDMNSTFFDTIYEKGYWNGRMQTVEDFYNNADWPPKERKSASGQGSNLGDNTKLGLKVLRDAIRQYNVTTMIDIPCGDANWIFDSWETDSLELYIGLDIVKPVIEFNAKRLAHHLNKVFRHWDGTRCAFPRFDLKQPYRSVDLVLSRDVLQHLSFRKGLDFLCNVFQSGARVFVTTTFPGGQNKDIKEGNFYRNDITKEPFSLLNVTNCSRSHIKHEPDLTCVIDLAQRWVKDWIAEKCSS